MDRADQVVDVSRAYGLNGEGMVMTLDGLHELGRRDYAAAWRAALAWTREGREPELDWDDHGKTRCVNIPATSRYLDLSLDRVIDTWINPTWRWYHGDNHELADDGRCTQQPCNRYFGGFHGGILGDRNEIWFGMPKPPLCIWDAALRLADRFALVRERAWLTAIGPGYMTLHELQANMPEWPHLFAFHAFTAAWLALSELDQVVLLDAWEDLNPPAHAWTDVVLAAPPSMSAEVEKHTAIPP